MKQIILGLLLGSAAFAQQYQYPVPKDITNTPIYGALGLPVFANSVTLTDTTPTDLITVPSTGVNVGRQFRAICVYNPSAAADLKLCFGASCSTAQMAVPATPTGGGLCLDNIYFGTYNNITVVRGWLSTAATVVPQIQIW